MYIVRYCEAINILRDNLLLRDFLLDYFQDHQLRYMLLYYYYEIQMIS